jgi:protein CMS1
MVMKFEMKEQNYFQLESFSYRLVGPCCVVGSQPTIFSVGKSGLRGKIGRRKQRNPGTNQGKRETLNRERRITTGHDVFLFCSQQSTRYVLITRTSSIKRKPNKMSGGDDLEFDDEYLNQNWHDNEDVKVEFDDSTREQTNEAQAHAHAGEKKRPVSEIEEPDEEVVTSKKKKKDQSPRNLLLEVGRGIAESEPDEQAFFLWTAFAHALKLKGEDIDADKFTSENFVHPNKDANKSSKYEKSMAKYLKSGVLTSMKRLKKWKVEKSPMVIIVCVSALRAVEVLKEISSLNIRVAKLFAKHMHVEDQVNMLKNNSYGIAVGTPNRLLKLLQIPSDDKDDDEGALSLDFTELILIDCHEDKKKFTVCTMNDTAPDMMNFIQQGVVTQMKKRKTIKFGMF